MLEKTGHRPMPHRRGGCENQISNTMWNRAWYLPLHMLGSLGGTEGHACPLNGTEVSDLPEHN